MYPTLNIKRLLDENDDAIIAPPPQSGTSPKCDELQSHLGEAGGEQKNLLLEGGSRFKVNNEAII
jgi:hypothetical protein